MAAHREPAAHEQDIDCRIRLAHADFIMANHVVHGVRVMPGVTFLDLVLRVLVAQGMDHRRLALRDVLFSEPVVVSEGHERELRVTVAAGAAGTRSEPAAPAPAVCPCAGGEPVAARRHPVCPLAGERARRTRPLRRAVAPAGSTSPHCGTRPTAGTWKRCTPVPAGRASATAGR